MHTFKWLFLNNLRSRRLGQIQNLPPPPDVPIKIQDNSRRHSSYSAILLSTSGSKRWISMVMADDQNSDFVVQRRGTEIDKGTAANSLSGQGKIAARQIRRGTADKPTAKRQSRE